jgi:hypothetical protein
MNDAISAFGWRGLLLGGGGGCGRKGSVKEERNDSRFCLFGSKEGEEDNVSFRLVNLERRPLSCQVYAQRIITTPVRLLPQNQSSPALNCRLQDEVTH